MKSKLSLSVFSFLIATLFFYFQNSVAGEPEARNLAIEKTLDKHNQQSDVCGVKEKVDLEKNIRDITMELTLEYLFSIGGSQTFELVIDGARYSRLTFPHDRGMFIFKGELGFLSKLFVGGQFGSSNFRKTTSSDEDWDMGLLEGYGYIQYQQSLQNTKSEMSIFDADLYYRFVELQAQDSKPQGERVGPGNMWDWFWVDKLSLDIFAGYQDQRGRYNMIDPMIAMYFLIDDEWWYLEGLPADIGLNSFYKIHYQGPRVGFRAQASKDKLTTTMKFSFAQLKTKAYGWWNLRDYAFWQSGKKGYGVNFNLGVLYHFTPSFSAGLGYNYIYCRQGKLKVTGIQPGYVYYNEDWIRNTDSKLYGFSVIFKYSL